MDMIKDTLQLVTGIPLLLCSIAALSLIAERAFFFFRLKDLSNKEYEKVLALLINKELLPALMLLERKPLFYTLALEKLKEEQHSCKQERDTEVSSLLALLFNKLKQRLSGLVTIASLSPMLGLLGTIVGLMRAFKSIGETTGPVEPSLVANGLWQALSTTAIGLIIAVVCIFSHAIMVSNIRKKLTRSQQIMNQLSQLMHKQRKPFVEIQEGLL